jgi:hypothetical protein
MGFVSRGSGVEWGCSWDSLLEVEHDTVVICNGVLVYADSVAITERITSCGEYLLVRVDRLAERGDENDIRRLLVVVESAKVGVSEGSTSEEASFGISLPECGLVAGVHAVERHGVRFSRLQRCGVTLEGNVGKGGRESEKQGVRAPE